MSQYTFRLPAQGGPGLFDAIDNSLTAGVSDAQLTYTGNDSIAWDRVNSARLRRGLPGLAAIGYPRPGSGDVGSPTQGSTFTVQGPPGLSEAQARQIFDQQNKAGSLVGLLPGSVVNSATQAAGGLAGALGQLSQAAAGIAGAAVGAATGLLNRATQSASALGATLTGSASQARTMLTNITSTVQNTGVTNGINVGDFARQATAVAGIAQLSQVDVRAGMAQVSKLVNQGATQLTDTAGLGKFGLDAKQLEAAGLLKPGTAATYLAQGANTLTSVLNSPAVWTGKNGVTNLDALLSSPAKQELAFQNLMSSGVQGIKNLGVPVDALSASSLTGVALNAAKSVETTVEWAKGAALPGPVKAAFDTVSRDGAFATSLAETKLNGAMLQQVPAIPGLATCNRATVDAAVGRVIGNDKVPEVNYTDPAPQLSQGELTRRLDNGLNYVNQVADTALAAAKAANQAIRDNDPVAVFNNIEIMEQAASDLTGAVGKFLERQRNAENLDPPATDLASQFVNLREEAENFIKTILESIAKLRERAAAALTA